MSRETPEQRAERILAELRAAASEAAGVLKDLQAAAKDARRQVDEYASKNMTQSLNDLLEQLNAGGRKFIVDHLAHLDEQAERVARQAETTIKNAGTIDALVRATAEAIAERTIFVDGEPMISYGDPNLGATQIVQPYE
jgi:ElaB/YqjD/DUF883 family membrane-anchored ribosome-binding protein